MALQPNSRTPDDETATAVADIDVAALYEAFVDEENAANKVLALPELERLVNVYLRSEPLRLGPLGAALIRRFPASLTGHVALQRFYAHLEEDAEAIHAQYVDSIGAFMAHDASGTRESPFTAMTRWDAYQFLRRSDFQPVGAIYDSSEDHPLMLRVLARDQSGRVESRYFRIASFSAFEAPESADRETKPIDVIGHFARIEESPAQLAMSLALLAVAQGDSKEQLALRNRGATWLRSSLGQDNVLANFFYARFLNVTAQTQSDQQHRASLYNEARSHFREAIEVGYDEAMFQLAWLYLNSRFGHGEIDEGIGLLRMASDLGNLHASTSLGELFAANGDPRRDLDLSYTYYERAALDGGSQHRLAFVDFLINTLDEPKVRKREFKWVRELAREDNVRAMLQLGEIYAKGLYRSKSLWRAKSWYRKIAKHNPQDAEIINEVAWVLATTNIDGLRAPRYAVRIMDNVMSSDEAARREVSYIDTWAAAYAATGDFDRAVALQQEALERASQETATSAQLLEILRQHLDEFKAGRPITEPVP